MVDGISGSANLVSSIFGQALVSADFALDRRAAAAIEVYRASRVTVNGQAVNARLSAASTET